MKIRDVIDWAFNVPFMPIRKTRYSDSKMIRVLGVILYFVLFYPTVCFAFCVGTVLALPAMIEETLER